MAKRLDHETQRTLASYLADVRELPNESAKRHRFTALVEALFPGSGASMQLAAGVEKRVRIDTSNGQRRGSIDSYYGNAVIEFEYSLKATGGEAERQLRDYVAGVWAAESPDRPLLAIASDGLTWKTYRPRLVENGRRPSAENVRLEELRTLALSDATLDDFWVWLTSLLFRRESILPTVTQFRLDFGVASPAFHDGMEALGSAWAVVGRTSEPRLAFDTWKRYLAFTYGSLAPAEDLEALFLKHTYLVSIARMLLWASFSKGRTSRPLRDVASAILSGEFFVENRLANLVEDDFFQWARGPRAEAILAPTWVRVLSQLQTYDLTRVGEDVLKGVYQELVDPVDRHELGEYYTPDWLCERVVTELLPKPGWLKILDPACGSGSFLRAAIARLLDLNEGGTPRERLEAVLEHVVGIDIHPVAVNVARATYLLALGPLIKAARRPIELPIYLADSLFLPTEVRQMNLGESADADAGYEIKFGTRQVVLPAALVETPDVYDAAIKGAAAVARVHAVNRGETKETLAAYLARRSSRVTTLRNSEAVLTALWSFADELAGLIRTEKNSIWAFIVVNSYRPAMLRRKFDLIVGNPPWLSYRYIADPEYQAEVKQRAVDEYRIAPRSQKLLTQMELATVFLAHALASFGKDGARIGFVMPRSVLSTDQHTQLRTRQHIAPLRLTSYWDLRAVRPLFNVPACVLFATRDAQRGGMMDAVAAAEWDGHLPLRDVPWSVARSHLNKAEKTARLIFLGKDRNAFSTSLLQTRRIEPSPYAKRFRQGATLVPRNFYFVRAHNLELPVDADRLYWCETDPVVAEEAKAPYRDVRMRGEVEGRFLFSTALSRHVLPFVVLPPTTVALPLARGVQLLYMQTAAELRKLGHREFASWMDATQTIWARKRGAKAKRQNVYQRLDYQKGLTGQDLDARFLVLYNTSGKHLSAAYVDRESLGLPFVADHKVYWGAVASEAEAAYLSAVLNAPAVNEAIKPFQSLGLLGERDIHKKVLELPIPRYSADEERHSALAALGARARAIASEAVMLADFPRSLGQQRGWVRETLKAVILDIDVIVKDLLRTVAPAERSIKVKYTRTAAGSAPAPKPKKGQIAIPEADSVPFELARPDRPPTMSAARPRAGKARGRRRAS